MAGGFDPYHKWLGIPPEHQPPDRYRLLGVARFESDLDVIESAADRLMNFLRQQSNGPNTALAEKLLGEIAMARLDLLDPEKKKQYDSKLRKKRAAAKGSGSGNKSRSSNRAPGGKTRTARVISSEEPSKVRSGDSRSGSTGGGMPVLTNTGSSSVTDRARGRKSSSKTKSSQRRAENVESEGVGEEEESGRNMKLAVLAFAVLAATIGIGSMVWSLGAGDGDDRRQVATSNPDLSDNADEETSSEADSPKVTPVAAEDPEPSRDSRDSELPSVSPLEESDSESLGRTLAAKPVVDIDGQTPTVGVNPIVPDESPSGDESEDPDEESIDDPREEPSTDETPPTAQPKTPPVKPVQKIEKPAEDKGEGVVVSIEPPQVKSSPHLRPRGEGESAEDYLEAIGLEEREGVWALVLEDEVTRLVEEFDSMSKEISGERDAAKKKLRSDRKKLSKLYGKEKKILSKKLSKMSAAEAKAAKEAFTAEWAEKKEQDSRRVPIDPKDRKRASIQFQQFYDKAELDHTVERTALTYKGLSTGGDGAAVAALDTEFAKKQEKIEALTTTFTEMHAVDVQNALDLAAVGAEAYAQFQRVSHEYAVLSKASWIQKSIEEAGGKLGPTKSFTSLGSKTERAASLSQDKLVELTDRLTPFSDPLFRMPRHELLLASDGWDTLGKPDPIYSDIRAVDDPEAFLIGRGLIRQGDNWRFAAELQVEQDLKFSSEYSKVVTPIVEAYPEELRAAHVLKQRQLEAAKKKIDEQHKGVFVGSSVNLNALPGFRDNLRKYLRKAHPVEQFAERLVAADDAVANLKSDRADFLAAALERADQIGIAYGDIAADDEVIEALGLVGGRIEPSPAFGSAVSKIQQMVNRP